VSCRSTACSSVATSYARAVTDLSDGQIQSLFHSLKRQGKDEDIQTPTQQEYLDGLDRLSMLVRNDESLSEIAKERLVGRLNQARQESVLDGPAWFAVQNIRSSAKVAEDSLASIYTRVGNSFGKDSEDIRLFVASWMYGNEDDFEDVNVEDPNFRYDLTPGVPEDERTSRALRKLGYEHYLTQAYPVFVYGTLRPGQGNYRLMSDAAIDSTQATLSGHAIYGAHRGFPYAAEHEDPSAVTVGDIVWLSDTSLGAYARDSMDGLEGFDSDFPSSSHYERVLRDVTFVTPDGHEETVKAWTYMARGSARRQLREEDRIADGDWVKAKAAYRDPRPFYGQYS